MQCSYVLFSIGNIKPLFQATFATCWKSYTICNKTWIQAIEYMEVIGIIIGQILVGIIGDWSVNGASRPFPPFDVQKADRLRTGSVDDGV